MCYYFDDIINRTKTNFSNILLNQKLYENISAYNILYKIRTGQKPLHIRFRKMDGFIISLNGKVRHLRLFDYGLFNKKVVLQIVLVIILERSELIHFILCLSKNIKFS